MRKFTLPELPVKRYPLPVQFTGQLIQLPSDGLAQKRDVNLRQNVSFFLNGNQLNGEMPMLQAVINIQLTGLQSLPDLPVQPEFIAAGMESG